MQTKQLWERWNRTDGFAAPLDIRNNEAYNWEDLFEGENIHRELIT